MGLIGAHMPCSSLTPMGCLKALEKGFDTEEIKASCSQDNTLPLPSDASTFVQTSEGNRHPKENLPKTSLSLNLFKLTINIKLHKFSSMKLE